ncbi:MAG TPA: hypothetical protein VF232_13110 [Gaiellaceae bacterium]
MGRASQTLGAFAAVAMVLAAAGATLTFTASGASAARAPKATPLVQARAAKLAGEQFRGNVQTMLSGLRGVVKQMRANPATAKSLSSTGTNLLPMVTAAKKQVAGYDWAELGQLQASLSHDPNWQQAPRVLSAAVAAFDSQAASPSGGAAKGAPAPAGGPLAAIHGSGTFTDDCFSAGDPYAEVIAVLAANEVQSALQAAALAAPGVIGVLPLITAPTGIRLGLMVAWGVANGIYLGLAQALEIAVDCAETAFSNTQETTWPHDPANSDTIVPGSTQFSIDRLIAKAGNSQTTINAVQTTVNTVATQTDTVDTAVTALNNILNDITIRVDDVQTDLQTLQTNVAVLRNTEVTILKKADSLIANLGTLETLQLRMEIEQNLDKNQGESPIGLFQLPAAFGGYLEVVKSIVTDTLAKQAAVGNPSPKAMTDLIQANAAFTAGTYKTAYGLYRKAYTDGR